MARPQFFSPRSLDRFYSSDQHDNRKMNPFLMIMRALSLSLAPDQQHQSPSEAEETHGQYFHPAGAVHLLLFLSYNGDPGQSRRKREATKTVELFANLSALLLPSTSLKSRCFTYPFGVNAFCLITTHFCSTVTFTQQLKRALP